MFSVLVCTVFACYAVCRFFLLDVHNIVPTVINTAVTAVIYETNMKLGQDQEVF